jgi:hypothetical protein
MLASSALLDAVDYRFIDSEKWFRSHFGLKNGGLIVFMRRYSRIERVAFIH